MNPSLLWLVLIPGLIVSGVVALINKFAKKRPILKYVPSTIALLAVGVFIVKARWFSQGMEGLGNILFAIIAFGSFLIPLITAVAMDLYQKNKKRDTL